jgi:subtilase family serine protease
MNNIKLNRPIHHKLEDIRNNILNNSNISANSSESEVTKEQMIPLYHENSSLQVDPLESKVRHDDLISLKINNKLIKVNEKEIIANIHLKHLNEYNKTNIKNNSANLMKTIQEVNKIDLAKVNGKHKNQITPVPFPFSGKQLLQLYNVTAIAPQNGARAVKIAIIIAYSYPNLLNDLKIYWNTNFGTTIPLPKVTIHSLGHTFNKDWATEECLDLQMIATISPYSDIYVVEAKSNSLFDLTNAVTYAKDILNIDVISMSWGCNDSLNLSNYNSIFTNSKKNNNSNICYCASTGDDNYVSWPAVLSNCIAVGGTTLYNSNNSRVETIWNKAGCGYSKTVKKPKYQNNISQITGSNRCIPDISLIANPDTGVMIYNNNQWIQLGGTSLSCPLFAGMLSIFNQNRLNNKLSTLTTICKDKNENLPPNNIQSYLYTKIYNTPSYKTVFYDITSGNNKGSKQNGNLTNYPTSRNYDIPTGLGSINCDKLCINILEFKA